MRITLACSGEASDSLALVDADRLAELSAFAWHTTTRRGPARYVTGKPVYLWHQVAGCRAIVRGHPHDCRRLNLIPVTFRQVMQQRRKRSGCSSRYKGVTQAAGKWKAQIAKRHIGYFDNEESAARAYDRVARAEFKVSRLNFPVDRTPQGSD